jgi:biopolymer transport protein ExbD
MKFRRQVKRKVVPTVDMTPIIDVVFQLLIFFMVTSSFVVHTALPIEDPVSAAAKELNENPKLTITLMAGEGGPDNEGKVFLFDGTQDVEIENWDTLRERLATLRQGSVDQEPVVHIRPDKEASSGRLLYVTGLLVEAGIKQYSYVATPPEA